MWGTNTPGVIVSSSWMAPLSPHHEFPCLFFLILISGFILFLSLPTRRYFSPHCVVRIRDNVNSASSFSIPSLVHIFNIERRYYASLLDFLAPVKITWCMNSPWNWCVCGEAVHRWSYSVTWYCSTELSPLGISMVCACACTHTCMCVSGSNCCKEHVSAFYLSRISLSLLA